MTEEREAYWAIVSDIQNHADESGRDIDEVLEELREDLGVI